MTKQILVVLVLAVIAGSPGAMRPSPGQTARVVEITAQRFEFWPSEIRVREGDTLELRIRSDDTLHGFRIVGTGVNLLVPKRGKGEAVATFSATQAGRYTIECSRMCGAGHNFMRATLIVEPAATGGTR